MSQIHDSGLLMKVDMSQICDSGPLRVKSALNCLHFSQTINPRTTIKYLGYFRHDSFQFLRLDYQCY